MNKAEFADKIRKVFEETQGDREDMRIWPFFAWIFISLLVGDFSSIFVQEKYQLITALIIILFTGTVLFKPMLKLCIKKPSQKK